MVQLSGLLSQLGHQVPIVRVHTCICFTYKHERCAWQIYTVTGIVDIISRSNKLQMKTLYWQDNKMEASGLLINGTTNTIS